MAAARVFVIGAVAAVAATVFMARKDPTDHYAALGVDRRASKDEIRAAYKQAALRFHPDKCASKRGLWHALLGGAARCARRFHAASAAEEVLSDDTKRIEYDVELARIEFERTARRQRQSAYGGGGLLPDWFRPGLVVYYLFVACLCLVIWTYALEPVLRGAKRAVEPKQTAADRSAARMAAVRRQQEALSAAPRRPAPAGRPPAPDAAPPPPRRRPVPASAPTPGLLPPLLQPPAARRPPDAGAERESSADEARRVRSETDDAYARSLAEDQRKEEQRAAAHAEEQREQAIRDRREAARQLLAATPEATGPTAKPVRVRLPEGQPLARTFSYLDPISLVRSFVDASGRAPRNFALVYLGPPIATLDDDDAPLSSLGPGPVTLMVTDLDA
jgi:curved DNA-binding protein CbpA